MSMDCKTCRGEGFVSFEAGAVVKRCPKCNGTGSSKFNAICEHIVSPLTKELAELRTANQRLEGEVARLKAALDEAAQDIADWGAYASDYFQEKHDLDGCIAKYAALSTANGEVTE